MTIGFSRPRTILDRPVAWLPIPGFDGYEVSNDGRIRSRLAAGFGRAPTAPRELKRCNDGHGYLRVYLRRDGRTHSLKVSWLVLAAFVGPRPPHLDACHGDGFRDNDVVNNLRWDTRRGNLADTLAHGTRLRGEAAGSAKLTGPRVDDIRRRLARGETQSAIARDHGVTQTAISKINRGLRWGAHQ
jgi:hypothetical protein